MMLFNADSEPDENGVITTETEVEVVNTIEASNIVTRKIVSYGDDLPTLMRFGQVYVEGEIVSNASLS